MHNVNILTIHKEPNYGAVLQAYALYKTIENLGHVPYIINLDMDYRRFPYSLKYRVLLGLHKWMKGYSHCLRVQLTRPWGFGPHWPLPCIIFQKGWPLQFPLPMLCAAGWAVRLARWDPGLG